MHSWNNSKIATSDMVEKLFSKIGATDWLSTLRLKCFMKCPGPFIDLLNRVNSVSSSSASSTGLLLFSLPVCPLTSYYTVIAVCHWVKQGYLFVFDNSYSKRQLCCIFCCTIYIHYIFFLPFSLQTEELRITFYLGFTEYLKVNCNVIDETQNETIITSAIICSWNNN